MQNKIKIGVMGSASGPTIVNKIYQQKSYTLGKEIAEHNCILINGACPGLPNNAAQGSYENQGFVIGISPAFSQSEHINVYKSPTEFYNFILYTGFGLMERDIVNIRSSDAIIIVGGGIGSLNEFTIAYDELKPIGVLTKTGGISDHIEQILKICDREMTPKIVLHLDPKILLEKILDVIKKFPAPEYEDSRVRNIKKPLQRR